MSQKQTIQHPLYGISPSRWIQLVSTNKGVDPAYLGRGAFITVSSLLFTPARLSFNLRYRKKILNTQITHPPVFIIGHWRSGTTYLHELLSHDPQFCYFSMWQTLLPDSFLTLDGAKWFFANFLPDKRPMDNIDVAINGPYEEEAGLAVLSPWSFFHCLHFPKNAELQYLNAIHQSHLTPAEKEQWNHNYLYFIKAVTYANNGKRLLSKNPPNTARISTILEMIPEARFVHIYRNPYKVYLSTKKMRMRVLDKLGLQQGNEEEIERQVIENYKRLMTSFFDQQDLIPPGNLVDVRYEDLVADPLKQVRHIYKTLKIPHLQQALPGMKSYLERKKNYKTNVYEIDKKIIDRVTKEWEFTIKKWNYSPPKST